MNFFAGTDAFVEFLEFLTIFGGDQTVDILSEHIVGAGGTDHLKPR